MTEDIHFTSYANGEKLKKLTVKDINKAQRAHIISLPCSAQQSIKDFMKEYYPEYFAHYSRVSIINVYHVDVYV